MRQKRDRSAALVMRRNPEEMPTSAAADVGRYDPVEMGRRRRVLIVVQNLPVRIDRRVWQECRALIACGYQVSVICPRGDGERRHQIIDGVSVWTYRGAPTASGVLGYIFEFVYCWLRSFALTLAVARKEGFDVIQACNPPDTYWLLAVLYKPFGRKFVFDHHDLCPELYRSRFDRNSPLLLRVLLLLERANQAMADHVIVTNDSYRQLAMTRGRKRPDRVTVVRSGPDPDLMKPASQRPELRRGRRHLACYLGVMGPQDGVDQLLDAIEHYVHGLRRTDCFFALLGFGDCLDELRVRSSRLALDDWVEFTGLADDVMIRDYLSTAAVGLSPDPRSPLNEISTMNKTLEYMAYGLPVVAYDLVETRVSAADAAVYAASDTAGDFARTLAGLLDDPEGCRVLGARGRERIVNELSWQHSARRYVEIYDHLLGARPVIPVPRQGEAPVGQDRNDRRAVR